jgi:hypothetical protein
MKNTFQKMFAVLIMLFSFTTGIFAQDTTSEKKESVDIENALPQGVTLFNQLKYSNDNQKKIEIFEDWFNLDYRYDIFSAGIRLVSFQPKDPVVSGTKRKYSEIDFKYFKTEIGDADEGGTIIVGNYYALFGRGLILKSYENRNTRIDNNLLGVKLTGKYKGFVLNVLSGMPENIDGDRKDVLYAADLEYGGLDFLKTGVTFASNTPATDGVAKTTLASFRIQPKIWNFDFYGEYGIKQNDDIKKKYFNNNESIVGKAIYGSSNFYYGSFSILGEYKYYDNYTFSSSDNYVNYNTPPSGRKDYSYILLNRHPSALNQNNEKGFQVEANYFATEGLFFNLSFGVTKTLDDGSYYQRINDTHISELTQLKEGLFQSTITWNNRFSTIAGIAYNEELATNTKNITPVLENRYYFDDINTVRFVVEHQQTKNRTTEEKYYSDVFVLEYLRSPKLSVSLVTEMDTHERESGRLVRSFWNFIQFGYSVLSNTEASLLIGSRQAGAICIGGVCRYEPEFQGVELKLVTRM